MATQTKSIILKKLSNKTGSHRIVKVSALKSYGSPALAAIHEAAEDLHKAGMIDNRTMREFDEDCLTPLLELSPTVIRKIRKQASISQSVFARHLNVTTGVVSKWERGEKQPRGPAAKLLSLAAKNGIASIA